MAEGTFFVRRFTGDGTLDHVELSDPIQGIVGSGARVLGGGLGDLEELTSGVRPAPHLQDATVFVQGVETRIGVGLEVASVGGEHSLHVLATPIIGEFVEHCRRMLDPLGLLVESGGPRVSVPKSPS